MAGTGRQPPKYKKIADQLLRQINDGVYLPGQQLPTQEQMVAEFGTSLQTVRGALDELRRLNVIRTGQGSGSFVRTIGDQLRLTNDRFQKQADAPRVDLRWGGPGVDVYVDTNALPNLTRPPQIEVQLPRATPEIATLLGVSPKTPVLRRVETAWLDERIEQVTTTYLPNLGSGDAPLGVIVGNVHQQWPSGLVGLLGGMGHPVTIVRETISPRMPSWEEAGIGAGREVPLLVWRLEFSVEPDGERLLPILQEVVRPGDRTVAHHVIRIEPR
jgi:GntR family transcriptional regulator